MVCEMELMRAVSLSEMVLMGCLSNLSDKVSHHMRDGSNERSVIEF